MSSKIGVLASGAGTTAQALLDASLSDELEGSKVAVVVSDKANAPVLDRAADAGVEPLFLDPKAFPDREAYSVAIADALEERGVDFVCLAGFMKVLSPPFIKRFEKRVLNNHPSLLPAFPGAHPVRDTLAWGVKVTGATVHFVDEEMDNGAIVLQEPVAVLDGDDEETLHERIKQVERRLYPQAVRLVLSGRTRLEGRRVLIDEGVSA